MIRFLVRLGALLAACLAHGAWTQWPGTPLVERMELPQNLRFENPAGFAQHPVTGEIVVGDLRQILVFDGANWRAHGRTEQYRVFRALAFAPDGRTLWTGGSNELGFFRRDVRGGYHYSSLVPHLPADVTPVSDVWLVRPTASGADFVCRQSVLRWDGKNFRAWSFPTTQRLFPTVVDGELWFTHPESGLYRFGSAGPEQIAPASHLPPRPAIEIFRRHGELLAWSASGIAKIGPRPATVSTPELTAVMEARNPTAAADLGLGITALGTLNGCFLIRDDRDLAGQISRPDIPITAGIYALFLDRDNWLWVAAESRIFRVPARGAPAHIVYSPQGYVPGNRIITSDSNHVWLLADRELIAIRHHNGQPLSAAMERIATGTTKLNGISAWRGDLLYTAFRQFGRIADNRLEILADLPARSPWGFERLNPDDDQFGTLEINSLAIFRPQTDGTWTQQKLTRAGLSPSSLVMDPAGYLWVGENSGHAKRYQIAGDTLIDLTPPELRAGGSDDRSWVLRANGAIWIIQRGKAWCILPDGKLTPTPLAPPFGVVHATVSPDGRRIYLSLERSTQGTRAPQGVGIVELDERGAFRGWHEPWVPGLPALGGIFSVHATAEPDGTDRLWMAGPNGALHIRTDALSPWPTPQAPLLIPVLPDDADPRRLPFNGHAVTLRLQSAEIARRPELRFETRLVRDGDGDWATAATQDAFEFSNLIDGSYRFEARTVTPTGGRSEPVSFAFVVLPPWYRSGWAFAGYAALGLVAVLGAFRYRERRVRARNAELERLVALRTAELEKANAAKDEFLASMSHEIRNPMNGVVGLSAAIDTAPLDPEGRHRFDLLRHCAAHLATLLEDILDFSRLQSGRIELHEAPFSPAELLESVVAITASDSAAAGLPVKTALAPQTPARLLGDARRLRQILLNFVTNALKYAGRGEVDVTVWTRPAPEGRVELTCAVSDEGPGIPPDEQAKVFAKFERGSAARRSRTPGTGMGLAVCRTLAEQMGGRVWLESEPGQGSTFYFALPLAVASDPFLPAEPLVAAVRRIHKTALVVDDEDYNCIAHAALLGRHGFDVRTARSGDAALALSAAERFDLVLLDYDMPDITGPELARRLRAQHAADGRQPFLIAATAYSTVEKREECLAAGMDAFLGKPIIGDRLREALAEALRSRPSPLASDLVPGSVEESADPDGYVADQFDNLRLLAAHKGRTLAAECENYAREFATDLESLHEAIQRCDPAASARNAHQLAGRFAFLHERPTAELALELEQLCRSHRWEDAARFERVLAGAWQQLRPSLNRHQTDPAA